MTASSSTDKTVERGALGPVAKSETEVPRLPFGDGLRVDAVAFRQRPQALLTMLYRSTDCLCRCGAPMKNLAHSASFESLDKHAPSKPGTKQLGNNEEAVRLAGHDVFFYKVAAFTICGATV